MKRYVFRRPFDYGRIRRVLRVAGIPSTFATFADGTIQSPANATRVRSPGQAATIKYPNKAATVKGN